jgi:AmpD protein
MSTSLADPSFTVSQDVLQGARVLPSPHCDARPAGVDVDLVVLHSISLPPGQFGGDAVERLFLGTLNPASHSSFADLAGVRVSSHLFIRRDGEVIQFVPFQQRAWHAGKSSWQGRDACNDFSIGIELEGSDYVPYDLAQYAALNAVLQALYQAYPLLDRSRVVGHAEIAPGRKTDPGPAFDWARVHNRV